MRILLRYLHLCGAADLERQVPRVNMPAPRDVTVTDAERDRLLENCKPHMRCWLLLCSDLALRSGTAARLAPEHFNPDRREVSIRTKGSRQIILPVTDELCAIFATVPATADQGTPYVAHLNPRHNADAHSMRRCLWHLRKKLGITKQITPHDFRRTAAVKTLDLTQDLRIVQALLGHGQLRSTLHYLDHRIGQVSRTLIDTLAHQAPRGGIQ